MLRIKRILHSVVTSRFHSNNALLYNIPTCHLQKLQRVHNMYIARSRVPTSESTASAACSMCRCYCCLNGSAPRYLTPLLPPPPPTHTHHHHHP